VNIAAKIESMRVAHEARAFRQWEAQWSDDDWLDAEMDRILSDKRELAEAVYEANPDMTISEAVALEAQRRLRDLQERDE